MTRMRGIFQKLKGEKRLDWLLTGGPPVLILCVMVLWTTSISSINPRNITDYGLVSVLPLAFFVALGLLTISFCLLLPQRPALTLMLFLHVVVLIVIIFGTLALVYEVPRYAWTYKHIGVVSYIQRYGSVDPTIDIYHNWPGFFALSALFTDIAGFDSALSFAAWGPMVFNLLYLCPLLLIYKASTKDKRLIWLGVWFFYLTQWIGHDYFTPQSPMYSLYLVILGICLTWFRVKTTPSQSAVRRWLVFAPLASLFHWIVSRSADCEILNDTSRPIQRVALMGIIILMFVVIVFTHQLTPFITIICVAALVVFQRCNARSLPILMAVLLMIWITYMAIAAVKNYAPGIIQSMFQISDNIDAGLFNIKGASPGRIFVALTARGLTAAIWGLALLGCVRRLRKGYRDLSIALLAIALLPLLTQPYGGEMLFRVYMFSLPFVAFFAAGLLYPSPRSGMSWRGAVASMLVSGAFIVSLLFAYYGNERINNITQNEVAAVQYLYHTAPPGSRILTFNENSPLKLEGYERYIHSRIASWPSFYGRHLGPSDIDAIARVLADKKYPVNYLLIDQSQNEYASLNNMLPPGGLDSLESALVQSEHFAIVFANMDSKIFVLANDGYIVEQ